MNPATKANAHETNIRRWTTFTPPQSTAHAALRGLVLHRRSHQVFAQLIRIVAEREIDVLIVAGDIFDSQNPSAESQKLFYETIQLLHIARPTMSTIIIAGNHDAAGRLEAPHPLLARFGVSVIGSVRRRDGKIDLERHHILLTDASGETFLHVLAVSYLVWSQG